MTATRTAPKPNPTRKPAAKQEPRPPHVFDVAIGADRTVDWTKLPSDEESRYPKFVRVEGGDRDPDDPDRLPYSIGVSLSEGDPHGRSVYFSILARQPDGDMAALEGFVEPAQVQRVHDALTEAIRQAVQLGILPPREAAPASELRVGPFGYVGVRGSAGEWLDKPETAKKGR